MQHECKRRVRSWQIRRKEPLDDAVKAVRVIAVQIKDTGWRNDPTSKCPAVIGMMLQQCALYS